jgi:chromosome segregation protein
MRIKRLEVQGFKSFKDKTVVHFDHNITGIVGPNGSGKSNIVDAFFWVMGEQSYKHMRGSGSDDLIFNGSSKYGPMGMAEATLVMETDVPDGNIPAGASTADIPIQLKTKEISVTRRVYRSGEGEYFVNGVPARLKDIHELFMDTGVGAKGYSVIEQGQIGKIVQSKPEERRLLIEEAAGIAKYKARKKESLRKMEATQGNLSRLNDVIQEIERNLGSLERQAQKARQYEKYKSELLDKEMTWGRRKRQVLIDRLDALKADRDALEQGLVGLRVELQIAENSIETDRVEQVTDTKLAEDLQANIQEMARSLAEKQSALELSRRRQGDITSQLEQFESEKSDLEASIATERERIEEREIESEEAQVTYEAAQTRSEEMEQLVRESRTGLESARRSLDSFKRELMNGVTAASTLTSKAASLAARIESARAQLERAEEQRRSMDERLEQTREETARVQAQAEEARTRKEELTESKRSLQTQVQQLEQALRLAERERDDSARAVTKLKSRLQSLIELAQAHEGFGDGPKAALDWAKAQGKNETIRALADAWDVDSGFEAALEGWLEDRLEALVATDTDSALAALEALRTESQGRASIFLSQAGYSNQAETAANFQVARDSLAALGLEVEGELSQFVRTNAKLGPDAQAVAAHAVARVCVVKTLNSENITPIVGALRCMGWALVTRDGYALDSSGVVRGGSARSDEAGSLLGRKRAIADLEVEAAAADEQCAALEVRAAASKEEVDQIRARFQSIQSELQEIEVRSAGYERDVHQTTRSLRDLENQAGNLDHEVERLKGQVDHAVSERATIEEEVQQITSGRSDLEDKISIEEASVIERESAVREQEVEFQTLKVSEASQRERATSLKREIEGSRSILSDRERRLNDLQRHLERITREQEGFSGGDEELIVTIESLTLDLGAARERLSEVKDRLEQSGAKLKSALARIKELHEQGEMRNQASNGLAIEAEKYSGELQHLLQNLEEKYGPGCLDQVSMAAPVQEEMGNPIVTTEMTAEEEQLLGEEVERLRDRIRRLGEVNPGAIQEFEEVSRRYEYLTGERRDLDRSIENLQEAIEHINRTSEDRFKRAFDAIADRFERLFPIIFGGGQAKLSLVYPENSTDILEAGVDILAQPPGKKIVNIGLLSGGEKALTAVSLIFAIFMVKPSPFCLLDEVDAPLDDANIGKFNALLREMSAKSQFILITHNKKTMELNDTLYGVTMEEPGVSKVVSIEMH